MEPNLFCIRRRLIIIILMHTLGNSKFLLSICQADKAQEISGHSCLGPDHVVCGVRVQL